MEFIIRRGEQRDMSSVLKLVTELAVFEKEPNAVEITVDDLLNNGFKEYPAFYTFVAEHDGVIVGMALFYNRFSTWAGPSIHLEDLIVTKEFRGKGIGTKLFKKSCDVAKSMNVSSMELVIYTFNQKGLPCPTLVN